MPRLKQSDVGRAAASPQETWLSPTELDHLKSIKSQKRRDDWLAGRHAAKLAIIEFLQDHHSISVNRQEIEVRTTAGGEPRAYYLGREIPEICLSISHSHGQGYAGLSVLETEGRIGVDVERIRPVHAKLASRILSEEERANLQNSFARNINEGLIVYWSLKEAAYKCLRPLVRITKRGLNVRIDAKQRRADVLPLIEGFAESLPGIYERHTEKIYSCVVAPPTWLKLLAKD